METAASLKPYQTLCTEFYELDKPYAPKDALDYYLRCASGAIGPILEPMCGTGRFFVPLLEKGFDITGFDNSQQMLNVCRKKCQDKNLSCRLLEASFENFELASPYKLIFIPSSSFCLLTDPEQVSEALKKTHEWLEADGKFIFEIETLQAASESQNIWKGSWVKRHDSSLLVNNILSHFDSASRIETVLCRYELWKNNTIRQTEVEEFRLRFYEISEIETLLEQHGFRVLRRLIPYTEKEANENTETVLLECLKK